MDVEDGEAPPNKSPSPPLQQPSNYDSPPHLSTNALECDTHTDLPNFSNAGALEAVIAGESTGATTSTDNKNESAVLDDVAAAEGGEMQVTEDEIVVEVSGNEGTDVDLEAAKVEEEEANLIIGEELELEVEVRDEKSIASNLMVEEEVEHEQQHEQEIEDHNLMGEEEDVGEQQQEEEEEEHEQEHEEEEHEQQQEQEEKDHNLMGEDEEDIGEQEQEEVEQEQEQEEHEQEQEEEQEQQLEQEEEEEDEEQERGDDGEEEGEEQERGEEEEKEEDEQGEDEEPGADGDIGLAENREAGEEMEVGVAEEQSGSVSGGKRKRGSGVKNSKSSERVPSKKKMEEDVCFICFDGGDLVLCDRR